MAQLKNGAFARGERGKGVGDAAGEFLIPGLALGVGMRALFAHLEETIDGTVGGLNGGGFFLAHLAAAQVIETDVGDDAVEPGVK